MRRGPADVGALLRRDSSSVFFTPCPASPALDDDGRAARLPAGSELRLSGFDPRYVPWSAAPTRTGEGFRVEET